MRKELPEKLYIINYAKLSNDKLIELWLTGELPDEEIQKIENLLKENDVIQEINPEHQ